MGALLGHPYYADVEHGADHDVFSNILLFFGIIFTIEIVLKLYVLRLKFFRSKWNWLDLIVVCLTLFELTAVAADDLPLSFAPMRLVRLVRLLKLISFFRTFKAFDSLYLLTTALRQSLSILGWAVISLFVLQMTFALLLTEVLYAFYFCRESVPDGGTGTQCADLTDEEMAAQNSVYTYYGTFLRCSFSMFEITLANWPPAARLLTENVHWSFMPLAVMHKLVFGFAVVGVITGVIMKETFKVAESDNQLMIWTKERQMQMHAKKMRALFAQADRSHDGTIDVNEFRVMMGHEWIRTWLASMELNPGDTDNLFSLLDVDHSGRITVEELIKGVSKLKGAARSIDLVTLMDAQSLFFDQVRQNLGLDKPRPGLAGSGSSSFRSRGPGLSPVATPT